MSVVPTLEEVLSWFTSLSNWGRWGDDDKLGTLNFVSPSVRLAAASEVREGITVSCARDFDMAQGPEHRHGVPQRYMIGIGQGLPNPPTGLAGAFEFIGFVMHGYHLTHLDGLSHVFFDGKMYNGRDPATVTSRDGATQLPITDVSAGIITRGVLLDIARLRGVDWLEPGNGVFPEDLEAAEKAQGVKVGPGDAVFLRTGYGRYRREDHATAGTNGFAGWHVACLPWLYERDVALIGCDTSQEVRPSGYEPTLLLPVHSIGIVAMGLWLLDNTDFEDLASTAARLGRWSFHLSVGPLRITGATGSPVNPIATF